MKIGLVLTSHAYSEERARIAKRSLDSLTKTDMSGLTRPAMVFLNTTSSFDYAPYLAAWEEKWDTIVIKDLPHTKDINGFNFLLTTGAKLVLDDASVTHVYFMYDDFLYHKQWLREVVEITERHPEARSCGVYRSRWEVFHRIIGTDGVDDMMTMLDGVGCVDRQEWMEYQEQAKGNYVIPELGCVTMDVHHSFTRSGQFWSTKRDYLQNLGIHDWLGDLDTAMDFVGEAI